ncbi:MAG: hypothetical protein AB7I42_23070 [Bradyrhizobium sp.]|uniref:hypothetical protein n=1 Tax=Bradyrhizobium sp. TaxID=376 RepID=UPI003D0B7E2D
MAFKRLTRGRALAGAGVTSPVIDTTFTLIAPALIEAGAATAGTVVTATVTGVALGDSLKVFPPASLSGVMHSAYVHGAGTVAVALINTTPGTVTLGTATWGLQVFRRT